MGDKLRVIVSHPARQAIVYHRPMGAERMGIDVRFLTGIYYKPDKFPYSLARWAPRGRRKSLIDLLELRRISGLSPENVITLGGPILECAYRAGALSLRQWWQIWDRLASLWLRLHFRPAATSPTVIHCFIECGLRTLRTARSRNITRLLEVTLPPLLADDKQMAQWGVSTKDFPTDVTELRRELAEADYVLVQSEFGAATVQKLGVRPDRVLRVHLGLETNEFRPRQGARKPGPLRAIFVGQLNRRKGVHHLLQAWRELQWKDAELFLAGNFQSAPPELVSEIRATPQCRALGHVRGSELLSLYQNADMLVHPSLAEGGCAAIYEAMGCGVPCIVSSHSTSAIRSGIDGLVFPVGDVEALKAAMLTLYDDAALRQQLSAAARRRAEQALSLTAFSRDMASIYRGVAEAAGQGRCSDALKKAMSAEFWETSSSFASIQHAR
jgi:glycosyltransferase involved in cell wall biosynthesis